jgi:hypothetical protein
LAYVGLVEYPELRNEFEFWKPLALTGGAWTAVMLRREQIAKAICRWVLPRKIFCDLGHRGDSERFRGSPHCNRENLSVNFSVFSDNYFSRLTTKISRRNDNYHLVVLRRRASPAKRARSASAPVRVRDRPRPRFRAARGRGQQQRGCGDSAGRRTAAALRGVGTAPIQAARRRGPESAPVRNRQRRRRAAVARGSGGDGSGGGARLGPASGAVAALRGVGTGTATAPGRAVTCWFPSAREPLFP